MLVLLLDVNNCMYKFTYFFPIFKRIGKHCHIGDSFFLSNNKNLVGDGGVQ